MLAPKKIDVCGALSRFSNDSETDRPRIATDAILEMISSSGGAKFGVIGKGTLAARSVKLALRFAHEIPNAPAPMAIPAGAIFSRVCH